MMSVLTGKNRIGDTDSQGNGRTFQAINPATNQPLDTHFYEASYEDVEKALILATHAFDCYRQKTPQEISAFLAKIAEEIEQLGQDFITRATNETGLPNDRIQAERARTVNQLKMFSRLVAEGSWVNACIDHAIPDRKPLPKPDLRRMLVPIGPVVVFGASNFPLAYSVAGGDSASALAAGNPIIIKAHPSHPGTSEYVADAIDRAVTVCGMPNGIFSMLHGGAGNEIGMALVKHPATKAVGFTGSLRGGRALFDAAASRPEPIPVYAEMGSVNPIFILPNALMERGTQLAEEFYKSATASGGQFCTNPGLVFGVSGKELTAFSNTVAKYMESTPPFTMLNKGIQEAFVHGVDQLKNISGVTQLVNTQEKASSEKTQGTATLFTTSLNAFLRNNALKHEVFGACSVIVYCESVTQLVEIARHLEGQLTATVHATEKELAEQSELLNILRIKAGRIIINGFSTGLEVCASTVHGGPYPATTDARMTSVGALAIERFTRPVCFQNFPQSALPDQLKDENPLRIWRKVDDEFKR